MKPKKIQVTQRDHERLTRLLASMRNLSAQDRVCIDKLQGELDVPV